MTYLLEKMETREISGALALLDSRGDVHPGEYRKATISSAFVWFIESADIQTGDRRKKAEHVCQQKPCMIRTSDAYSLKEQSERDKH